MSELWKFADPETLSQDIQGWVADASRLLDEGKGSLAALATVWGGAGSHAYEQVMARWEATSNELNSALENLAHTINASGNQPSPAHLDVGNPASEDHP
jgi:early secretory antigenic target protein ESAT-6